MIDWLLNLFKSKYRRDERNPFRRFCLKCGQQQEYFTFGGMSDAGWWEEMQEIKDPECPCHKDSR